MDIVLAGHQVLESRSQLLTYLVKFYLQTSLPLLATLGRLFWCMLWS